MQTRSFCSYRRLPALRSAKFRQKSQNGFLPIHRRRWHNDVLPCTRMQRWRFFISSLCAAGGAVLISGGKLFKRITLVPRHHPSAVHTDGVSLFKEKLFLAAELVKGGLHRIGTNTVPENIRIVQAIVTGNILARFLAVLVMYGRIERNTAAVLFCNRQIFGGSFFGAVLFGSVFGNDFFCALAGIVVKPCMPRAVLYSSRDLNKPASSCRRQPNSEYP